MTGQCTLKAVPKWVCVCVCVCECVCVCVEVKLCDRHKEWVCRTYPQHSFDGWKAEKRHDTQRHLQRLPPQRPDRPRSRTAALLVTSTAQSQQSVAIKLKLLLLLLLLVFLLLMLLLVVLLLLLKMTTTNEGQFTAADFRHSQKKKKLGPPKTHLSVAQHAQKRLQCHHHRSCSTASC